NRTLTGKTPICSAEKNKRERLGNKAGAGEGNRTLVVSLGSFCSAIELHPRVSSDPWRCSSAVSSRVRPGSGLTVRERDLIWVTLHSNPDVHHASSESLPVVPAL